MLNNSVRLIEYSPTKINVFEFYSLLQSNTKKIANVQKNATFFKCELRDFYFCGKLTFSTDNLALRNFHNLWTTFLVPIFQC